MATISKSWGTQTQVFGTGDAFTSLSGKTEKYTADIDLETSGYVGAHVVVEVDFAATPTDHVDVAFYGSLDGTNFDTVAFSGQRFDKATDTNRQSFIIPEFAHFRIGAKQTGTTDAHSIRAYYQPYYGSSA